MRTLIGPTMFNVELIRGFFANFQKYNLVREQDISVLLKHDT